MLQEDDGGRVDVTYSGGSVDGRCDVGTMMHVAKVV